MYGHVYVPQGRRVSRLGFTLITTLFAASALVADAYLKPPTLVAHGTQKAQLIAIGVIEAVAFGAAVAFLILCRKAFSRSGLGRVRIAFAWWVGSWCFHDKFHARIDHNDITTLLWVEWIFHIGSIVISVIAARQLWRRINRR